MSIAEIAKLLGRGTASKPEVTSATLFFESAEKLAERIHAVPGQLEPLKETHTALLPRPFKGWHLEIPDWQSRLASFEVPIVYVRADESWPSAFGKRNYFFHAFALTEISELTHEDELSFEVVSLRLLRWYRHNRLEPAVVSLQKELDLKNDNRGSFCREPDGTVSLNIQTKNLANPQHYLTYIDVFSLNKTLEPYGQTATLSRDG